MSRETPARAAARRALAAAIEAGGMRNAADSLRAGSWGNVWTNAALDALEATTRNPLMDDDGSDD